MPLYEYDCDPCEKSFEISHSIHDDPLTECPLCNQHTLERGIGGGQHVFVKTITTIGQLAEFNSKKMGKYKLSEEAAKKNEGKPQQSETGLTKDTYRKLCKMSSEQKKRWIMDGD